MKPTRIDNTLHIPRADVGLGYLALCNKASWNHAVGKDVLLLGVFATKFLKYKSIVFNQGLVNLFCRVQW